MWCANPKPKFPDPNADPLALQTKPKYVHILQVGVLARAQAAVDFMARTADDDKRKFAEAGLPWDAKAVTRVKLAGLKVLDHNWMNSPPFMGALRLCSVATLIAIDSAMYGCVGVLTGRLQVAKYVMSIALSANSRMEEAGGESMDQRSHAHLRAQVQTLLETALRFGFRFCFLPSSQSPFTFRILSPKPPPSTTESIHPRL
jgi:hypothetical protein